MMKNKKLIKYINTLNRLADPLTKIFYDAKC